MKRLILIAMCALSLLPVSCKVDRGTLISLPFFSVFGGGGTTSTAGKAITSFAIVDDTQTTIRDALINEENKTIEVILPYDPYGINSDLLKSLTAKFTTTGTIVLYDGEVQTSGVSVVDFSETRKYTVVASDNTTQNYQVSVTAAASGAKEITGISIPYVAISDLVMGDPYISLKVPYGTGLYLNPTINYNGQSISPDSGEYVSFTNSVSTPVTYRVTAYDSSSKDYYITITEAPNNACDLTALSFPNYSDAVVGFNGTDTYTVTLPFGTIEDALTNLITNFSVSTGAIVSVGGKTITTGSAIDYSSGPVSFRVTAQDGINHKDYTVNVSIDLGDAKEIKTFSINDSINNVYTGIISGTSISVTMPIGTALTGLKTNFTIDGDYVTIDEETEPTVTGSSINYSTMPVHFTVHAKNGDTQTYEVNITLTYLLTGTNVIGYYHNGSESIACLWYIGGSYPVKIDIENDTSFSSRAVSVSVSGNTMYAVGTYNNKACYWKVTGDSINRFYLDSTGESEVVDSLISGDDMYISGTDDISGANYACYWKVSLSDDSDQLFALTDGSSSRGYEMTMDTSGNIYIAGTTPDPDFGYETPCFWSIVSGSSTRHLVYDNRSNGRTVMLSGSDVVIGGWFVYTGSYTQAKTWTYYDQPVTDVNLPPLMESPNSSIVSASLNVSNNLYIVGQRTGTACYWLNGIGNNLAGSTRSFAYGIGQIGANIYFTGYHSADAAVTYSTACVWRRGFSPPIDLFASPSGEAAARDVFVKE